MGTTGQYFQGRRLFLFGKSVGNCTKIPPIVILQGRSVTMPRWGWYTGERENLASAQPAPPPEEGNFMQVNEKRLLDGCWR